MNPELRRNLWLEITVHRLLGVPLIMGLIFLALAAVDEGDTLARISSAALGGFCVMSLLWGTRLASNSVIDEIADKTWDWQRLSTLSPWTMTWGKLFGSTAFAWYGGTLCLLVFLATASTVQFGAPLRLGVSLIFITIALHAIGMALALHTSKQGVAPKRRSIGLLLILVLINIGAVLAGRGWNSNQYSTWYAVSFDSMNFLLCSSIIFAGWAVLGAYRAMCQSLMVRTTPWAWLLFLSFLTVYCAGFVWGPLRDIVSLPTVWAWIGLAWGLLFTYVMMFTEMTGPTVIRRITWKMQLGEWRRSFEELPCWPVTWIFTAICAVVVTATGFDGGYIGMREKITLAPIPLTLLAARDAGILMFFLAAPQPKRAVGTTIIYIVILSWILPFMLNAMDMPRLSQFILPFGNGSTALQLTGATLQAIIALALAWRRIRNSFTA
ncbi:MAG: hypothetical protein QM808_15965 [Steroidobacteraceae bacterium]